MMSREVHIVGFQVGRETYGVPIAALHEIVRVTEITAVPDAPDYIEGVINLRGKIVSVIDLRKRFGEKATVANRKTRILVVESEGRLMGLIVDAASDVLKIPAEDVEAPPAVFQEGGLNCVTGLGKYKNRLIVLLDINRLLSRGSLRHEAKAADAKTSANGGAEARAASAGKR
jgi:purine-binding chemotaxis protein CheW